MNNWGCELCEVVNWVETTTLSICMNWYTRASLPVSLVLTSKWWHKTAAYWLQRRFLRFFRGLNFSRNDWSFQQLRTYLWTFDGWNYIKNWPNPEPRGRFVSLRFFSLLPLLLCLVLYFVLKVDCQKPIVYEAVVFLRHCYLFLRAVKGFLFFYQV